MARLDMPLDEFESLYESQIEENLDIFAEENNIEDYTSESQSRWNAALMFVKKQVFADKSKLKCKPYRVNPGSVNNNATNYNAYNLNYISYILDIYIALCMKFDKEISIMGFSLLTGISYQTICDWSRNERGNSGISSCEIYKKIKLLNEESLRDIAVSGKRNPVGAITLLNHDHGYGDTVKVVHEHKRALPLTRQEILQEFPDLEETKKLDIVAEQE